jgi:predicted small lipoprotein YifL
VRRRLLPVALAAAALPALGGCGQKGPLYLPDRNARVVTSAPAGTASQAPPAAPAPAAPAPKPNDKDKDKDSQPPQPQPQ